MAEKPAGYAQEQTAIALAYKNNKMIADEILPRVTVDTKHYKWLKYDLAAGFTLPNTNWSPRSAVTEVDIAATDRERSCLDYGVGDHIPTDDISQSTDKKGILNRKTEFLTQIMVLDREVRVAGLVQNPANYAAENVFAPVLAWTDPDADPVGEVRAALSAMMLRGNVAVFGRELWELFAAHPKVVKSCNRNDGGEGFARARDVAELLELDKLLVGDAILNIKRPGQNPEFKKAWGKKLSLLRLDPLGGPEGFPSYGWTAEFQKRTVTVIAKPERGIRGSQLVTVGETVDEVISCPHLGALIEHP